MNRKIGSYLVAGGAAAVVWCVAPAASARDCGTITAKWNAPAGAAVFDRSVENTSNPVGVVIAPGNSGDPSHPSGPLSAVRDGLKTIADAADAVGLRIAFELIGQRRGSPLYTLPDIVSFVDDVGRDNVDILLDVFHSWCEPDLHDHLKEHVGRIVSVDLNDVRPEERSGFDRELPGRGRRTAPGIVHTLIEAGYDGWWNLEVFSDDGTFGHDFPDSYWKLPPAEFGILMRDAAFEVWSDATSAPGATT
jgi:sugar phosphate isomerase/epimerase